MQNSIRATIISQIQQIAEVNRFDKNSPALTDDLVLTNSGLDSLMIAILIARLEDILGVDPFTQFSETPYPVTLGDFIRFYERATTRTNVAAGQDR